MGVYFARMGKDGPVKIGHAIDVEARIAELQCGNPEPLIVLRVLDGPLALESVLHRAFRPLHIRGEWFRYSETMLTFNVREYAELAGFPKKQTRKRGRRIYFRRLNRQLRHEDKKFGPASEVRHIEPKDYVP